MDVCPADLGSKWLIAVVRLRTGASTAGPNARVGWLGRRWMRGIGVSDDVARATIPMATNQAVGGIIGGVGGGFSGLPVAAIVFWAVTGSPEWALAAVGSTAGLAYLSADLLPHLFMRRLHTRPLSENEVQLLRASLRLSQRLDLGAFMPTGAVGDLLTTLARRVGLAREPESRRDEVTDAFLDLISDVMRLENVTPETETQIRHTLRLLGDAIAQLPSLETRGNHDEEAADLLIDADMLATRARSERDPVVAQSYLRQAEAKISRARGADRNSLLARRGRVLRDEVREQINAARGALPVFSNRKGNGDTASSSATLSALAESVQGLAREAASLADAREELAEVLGYTITADGAPAPVSAENAGPIRHNVTTVTAAQAAPESQRLQGRF